MAAPVLQAHTMRRGALTRSGHGGVPLAQFMVVSGAGITAWAFTQTSGTTGHWTVDTTSAGMSPVPNAAGVAAQLGGGPYVWDVTATNADGTSTAAVLTINIAANTYTVSAPAQLAGGTGLRAIATTLGGKTIEIARGTYGTYNDNGNDTYPVSGPGRWYFLSYIPTSGRIAITSEDTTLANRSKLSQMLIQNSRALDVSAITFEGYLSATAPITVPENSTTFINQGRPMLQVSYNTSGTTTDCTFSDLDFGAPEGFPSSSWRRALFFQGQQSTPYVPISACTVSDIRMLRVLDGLIANGIENCTFEDFVVDTFSSDAHKSSGNVNANNTWQDGVMCRPIANLAAPLDHTDYLQTGGASTGSPSNLPDRDYTGNTYRRLMCIYANGDNRTQGLFFDDIGFKQSVGQTGYYQNNCTVENCYYDGAGVAGLIPDLGSGWSLTRNTIFRGDNREEGIDGLWYYAKPSALDSTYPIYGTSSNNVALDAMPEFLELFPDWGTVFNLITPIPATITVNAACSAELAAYYAPWFVNPDVSDVDYAALTAQEIADILRQRYAPIQNGPLMNVDGTYQGAFFPDGTWNDGSVYDLTPPSAITSSIAVSETPVGAPVTVTYQLDATAFEAVTITPGVSGVSGSYSPATVVIGIGSASGTSAFTASTAGAASLTATNDRALANPTPLALTVTAAPVGPTAYTQSAPSAASLGTNFTISYILDAPATQAVTLTPAFTLAGTFDSATVVIGFGETSGTVAFTPSVHGSGTLSVTNDVGLPNPANIAISVTACNTGQLIVLGIRP